MKRHVKHRKHTHAQSLVFDKEYFTAKKAKAWAKREGFHYGKVHPKKTTIRLRQFDPKFFSKSSFRTIQIAKGVEAVIGKLKKGYAFESETRRFGRHLLK